MFAAPILFFALNLHAAFDRPLAHHCRALLESNRHTPSTDRGDLKYLLTRLALKQRALDRTGSIDGARLDPHVDDTFVFVSSRAGARALDRGQVASGVGRLVRMRDDLNRDAADVIVVAHVLRGAESIRAYLDRVSFAVTELDRAPRPAERPEPLLTGPIIARSLLGLTSVIGGAVAFGVNELAVGLPMAGASCWLASTLLEQPVGRCLEVTVGERTDVDLRRVRLDSHLRIVRGALAPETTWPIPTVHVGLGETIDGRRVYIDHAFFADFVPRGEPVMIGMVRVYGPGRHPTRPRPRDHRTPTVRHVTDVPDWPGLVTP